MDPELEETRKLIAEARAGNRAAYEGLFRLYRADLERRVRKAMPSALRGRVEASDVVQEALIDAVKGFESFEYRGKGSFRGWLLKLLENRARKTAGYHGRQKRAARREERLSATASRGSRPAGRSIAAAAASPSSAAAAREEEERLQRMLAALPPDYREVLRQVRIEGRSLADVAAAMGRSENAVKKLLARALHKLGSGGEPHGRREPRR